MRTNINALFEGVKTMEELYARILERQIARHPELANAPDREVAAWRILAETTFGEHLLALSALAGPPDYVSDEQVDVPAESPDTVEGDYLVPLAAQVLTDRAVKAAGEAARALRADYLTRSDEALALRLLTEYGDAIGYCVLTTGGPKGFDPRRYFLERTKVVAPRRRHVAKAKAVEASDPSALALRRAKVNLRAARSRLKQAVSRLANAEKAQAEAEAKQEHRLLLLNQLSHGPLPAARERHAAAVESLKRAEKALAAATQA